MDRDARTHQRQASIAALGETEAMRQSASADAPGPQAFDNFNLADALGSRSAAALLKLCILAAILLLTALPAFANEIFVDDQCTLEQAINSAQGHSNNCEAGSPGAGDGGP